MALQHTRLTGLILIDDSIGPIYSNPSSTKTHIKGFLLHNTDLSDQVVNLHWVPPESSSIGTPDNTNRFAKLTMEADETLLFEIPYGLVLMDQHESIQSVSTTSNKVTIAILGDIDT